MKGLSEALFDFMHLLVHPFRTLLARGRWIEFSIGSAIFAWVVTFLLLAAVSWLIAEPAAQGNQSAFAILFGGVIFAPLVENLFVVVALAVLGNWFSGTVSVLVMTGLAIALHAVLASWAGISALVLFPLMGFSYQAWHVRGPKLAFLVIFLQHALFNLPAAAEAAMHAADFL
ncbi:MAG: hypothetical protein EOP37_25955 [Rubrivivax sp.]|nr:MAG: hypothetical protein EOP37_25955 [Rubrivivax sp.]